MSLDPTIQDFLNTGARLFQPARNARNPLEAVDADDVIELNGSSRRRDPGATGNLSVAARQQNYFFIGNMEHQQEGVDRFHPPDSMSGDEAMEDNRPNGGEGERSIIVMSGLPSEEQLKFLTRDAQPPEECVGCGRLSSKELPPVMASEIRSIVDLISKKALMLPPLVLATQIQRLYGRARSRAIQRYGQERCPLPEWKLGTIIQHVTNEHRSIPQLWQPNTLKQMEELQNFSVRNCVRSYDPGTGQSKLDKEQVTIYLNIVKTAAHLRRIKPETLAHNDSGTPINNSAASQVIATGNMQLIESLRRGRRRR